MIHFFKIAKLQRKNQNSEIQILSEKINVLRTSPTGLKGNFVSLNEEKMQEINQHLVWEKEEAMAKFE